MAVKVTIPSSSTSVKVPASSVSVRTPKVVTSTSRIQTAASLDGLANVDVTGVQDGYTFTYDAGTGKWVATPVSGLAIDSNNIQTLDGGTF